jgi:hypothetical protein
MQIEAEPKDFRHAVAIAVRLALRDLPWSLLTGTEKGRRPRDVEEARNERLAECVTERLLLGCTFVPPLPRGPPPSDTQRAATLRNGSDVDGPGGEFG